MGKGPDKFDCIAPPLATTRGPFSGYGFFMEKRESPLWTSSSPGITGQFLGRPTLVSCPRNHAGICVVWLLRITLRQRRETRLGTVRAWILADWVPAVLPDLGPRKMSLPSWEPLLWHLWFKTPSTTEVTEAWLEQSENSITQESLSSVQTGALPICMAPSGQRTLCAVLPNVFPKQGALPVLDLFRGCVQARRIMYSPNHSEHNLQPHRPGELTEAFGKLHSPSHSPAYSSMWAQSPTSLPLCRAKLCPHVTKELGVQVF